VNFSVALRSFVLLSALALVFFGLGATINAALGWQDSLLNHFWNMEALALAFALIAGYAYPHVRGVRKGDSVVAVLPSVQYSGSEAVAFMKSGFALAASDARKGGRIRIALPNHREAEGIVTEYAGTFSRAVVDVKEVG